ncbi:MAG: hypothetical protein ACD_65C00121G0002 [uncultured bacterium]|nr:MAG: hypothetical protein ACD_65C00121G0002 [uncultured bacterium]
MKFFKSFILFSTILVAMLGLTHWTAGAETLHYDWALEAIGEDIDLPTYEDDPHGGAYAEDGLSGLTSAVYYTLDFVKYALGGIAVLFIMISGYRLLVAGKASQEEITKQKVYLTWATVGLLLVFTSETIVKEMFFGQEGEILMGDESVTMEFGYRTNQTFKGIYSMMEVFVGAIAVFMIAYEGFRMVAMSYQEEVVTKTRNHIFWSLIALMMIGISEFLVKDFIFPYVPGEAVNPNIEKGKFLLASITNFVAGTIGLIAVGMLIYGGYLYIAGAVNEEQKEKGKKTIIGAVIGIIIAGAAFAITSTIIPLQG